MISERLKGVQGEVAGKVASLTGQLKSAEEKVASLRSSLERYNRFREWCEYLQNGETMGGFFGSCSTYAMFVRQYSAKPSSIGNRMELVAVDLVIIPDVLVEHKLCVIIPYPDKPGMSTTSSRMVVVPDIITRMQTHAKNSKNLSLGTSADVMSEPCAKCGEQAIVVAVERQVDDDNGYEFTVDRLCFVCSVVDNIAIYRGEPSQDRHGCRSQYYYTTGIYR